jgi:hypothetical protein
MQIKHLLHQQLEGKHYISLDFVDSNRILNQSNDLDGLKQNCFPKPT